MRDCYVFGFWYMAFLILFVSIFAFAGFVFGVFLSGFCRFINSIKSNPRKNDGALIYRTTYFDAGST